MENPTSVPMPSLDSTLALAGDQEANLKLLAQQTGAQVIMRGQDILLGGTPKQVERCRRLIQALEPLWGPAQAVSTADVMTAIQALNTQRIDDLQGLHKDVVAKTRRGDTVRAKTFGQRKYIKALRSHPLTFCAGPAGTGKTYLAALIAVQALLNNEYERLILTRPAVEAGERLGFLPGDLQQKVNPYLRPLYDALHEMLEPDKLVNLMERGIIEVAPLAYMRGRTLNNAFVIMDEAQNTTPAQMKMVLTRLGFKSRMVVTGDLTQTDLAVNQQSGLAVSQRILNGVEGVAFCQLSQADVVRHPLVQRIVAAYEKYEALRSPN